MTPPSRSSKRGRGSRVALIFLIYTDEGLSSTKMIIPIINVIPPEEDGYDTDTADYVPPDAKLPDFQWPEGNQTAECNYLEFKGKRRRSNDKIEEQKSNQKNISKGVQLRKGHKNRKSIDQPNSDT